MRKYRMRALWSGIKDWRKAADTFIRQRDEALDAVREAQAELTRFKEESARLSGELESLGGYEFAKAEAHLMYDMREAVVGIGHDEGGVTPAQAFRAMSSKLTEAQRTIASLEAEVAAQTQEAASWESACSTAMAHNDRLEAELATARNGLTWERGWDLLRKAQMQAVVEAALAWNDCDRRLEIEAAELRLAAVVDEYRAALDQPSQPEPASEFEAPHPCICYHAPEQHRPDGCEMTCGCKWDGKLREDTPASETAEGGEK